MTKRKKQTNEHISLPELVRTAAAAYEGSADAWDHLINEDGKRNSEISGDTLVDFIIIELADTYDATASRADQVGEAIRVMNNALNEVGRVLGRFETLWHRDWWKKSSEHPQTDEHLAACPSCMMAHDRKLGDK